MNSLNLEPIKDQLVSQQKSLVKLLATETQKYKEAASPLVTEMQEYVKQSPYNDFGEFIYKIMGGFVNFKKHVVGSLGASKKFFVEPSARRKRKLHEEEIFPVFSKDFESVISSPKKRAFIHDFVVFKAAVTKALSSFPAKSVSVPEVQFIETADAVFYNGFTKDREGVEAKRHFYIKSTETKVPDLVTVSFQEFLEYVYLDPMKASQFSKRYYIMTLTVFKRLAKDKLQFVDMLEIDLNPESLDLHLLDKFNVNSAEELLHSLITGREFGSHRLRVSNLLQFNFKYNLYSITDSKQASITCADINGEQFRHVLPETEGSIDGRNGISPEIVVNWADIIKAPEVQAEVRRYLDTWKLITKTWHYLKQKHSDKLLLHGQF